MTQREHCFVRPSLVVNVFASFLPCTRTPRTSTRNRASVYLLVLRGSDSHGTKSPIVVQTVPRREYLLIARTMHLDAHTLKPQTSTKNHRFLCSVLLRYCAERETAAFYDSGHVQVEVEQELKSYIDDACCRKFRMCCNRRTYLFRPATQPMTDYFMEIISRMPEDEVGKARALSARPMCLCCCAEWWHDSRICTAIGKHFWACMLGAS
jgi:hypothetical protein